MKPFIVEESFIHGKYFIRQQVNEDGSDDGEISKLIQKTEKEYQEIMREKFNSIRINDNNETYFGNKKDCEKAIEWLEDQYLIYYLAEN